MKELAGEIITRFPCCRGINFNRLTMAQASVVELIANLSEDSCYEFNLHHAVAAWSKDDIAVFFDVVLEAYGRQVEADSLVM